MSWDMHWALACEPDSPRLADAVRTACDEISGVAARITARGDSAGIFLSGIPAEVVLVVCVRSR